MFGNRRYTPLLGVALVTTITLGMSACSVVEEPMQAFYELPFIKPMQTSKPAVVQTNKIYYAPAQTYNLDLSASPFLGKLSLKESCTPEGQSLTIRDQANKFYRIDVININNNPKFPNAQNMSTLELSTQLTQMYKPLYNSFQEGITQTVKSPLGPAGYSVLALPNLDQIGLLIAKKNDYVYVVQHTEVKYSKNGMQHILAQVADAMQIPGKKLKKSNSELALSIDLTNATAAQLKDWKKLARCS